MSVISPDNFRKRIYFCRVAALFYCFFLPYVVPAQQPVQLVHLRKGRVTYAYAFAEIENQLHINVSQEPKAIAPSDTFLSQGWMPLEDILWTLRKKGLYILWLNKSNLVIKRSLALPSVPENPVIRTVRSLTIWVTDESDEPLPGATVKDLYTGKEQPTDNNGQAVIMYIHLPVSLQVTNISREQVIQTIREDGDRKIVLPLKQALLDVVSVGYARGTKAVATGGYVTMSRSDGQPLFSGVSNGTPQTMTEGLIPGVVVRQTSGIAGASAYLTVQGQSSLLNGSDPLYVIDDVPYAPGNQSMSNIQSGNSAKSLSPLSFIPPSDIERIDVLKDGDATSIYGSRGANGVVLITTRRWKPSLAKWSIQASTGISEVSRRPPLMNLHQYLAMRREALSNDKLPIDTANAPDLAELDTTRAIDWGKRLIGGTGHTQNAQVSLSGGTRSDNYLAGASYLKETNVFPSKPAHQRSDLYFHTNHYSPNKRLAVQVSGMLGSDQNRQFILLDPTMFQFLPPNAPEPLDRQGRLYFPNSTIPYANPLATLRQTYEAQSHNILINATGIYRLSPSFILRNTLGANNVGTREYGQIPISALNPLQQPTTGSAYFAHTWFSSQIVEPRVEYEKKRGKFGLGWLTGASWQWQTNNMTARSYTNYTSDALLRRPDAGLLNVSDSGHLATRYTAIFTRINGNWDDKYILNLTTRYDGSNRWSTQEQFGLFGAAGAAWVFSKETIVRRMLPILSFGKLRASYGNSGNDQVGDHVIQQTSSAATPAFQTIPGFYQRDHISSGQGWETTRKAAVSLDLGFLSNRLLFGANWYRHRSSNQLIADGADSPLLFHSTPAVLENKGWEFTASLRLIETADLDWFISLNWSLPVGRLLSYPGLASSSFQHTLFIGQSINTVKGFVYRGVDRQTGLFSFADLNHDGRITEADQKIIGKFDVTGFGGADNIVRWKRFQIELLVDGRIQTGINYLETMYQNNPPGANAAGPPSYTTALLRRWRQPGDIAPYQVLTTGRNLAANTAITTYLTSSAMLSNASFVRLRKVSLSYGLSPKTLSKLHLSAVTLFVNAQNLFTLSPYKGVDPEIQSALLLPTLRTVEGGFHVSF